MQTLSAVQLAALDAWDTCDERGGHVAVLMERRWGKMTVLLRQLHRVYQRWCESEPVREGNFVVCYVFLGSYHYDRHKLERSSLRLIDPSAADTATMVTAAHPSGRTGCTFTLSIGSPYHSLRSRPIDVLLIDELFFNRVETLPELSLQSHTRIFSIGTDSTCENANQVRRNCGPQTTWFITDGPRQMTEESKASFDKAHLVQRVY